TLSIVLAAPKPVIGGNVVREPVRIETPAPVFGARPAAEDDGPGETKGLWARMLHPQQTFESFVAGSANEFALSAARTFVDGTMDAPLLYIHGGFGFGKTH